jgi:hypothetical protein
LTDTEIRQAKPGDKLYFFFVWDINGLYLEAPPTGNKRW